MNQSFKTLIFLLLFAVGLSACAGVPTPATDPGDTSGTEPTAMAEATIEPTLVAAGTLTPEATEPVMPTEEPTIVAVNSPEPQETPSGEIPAGAIMVFRRDGGIAGFCDTMTISVDIVTLESCNPNFPHGEMPLDPAIEARLRALQEQFAAFKASESDAPGAADAMTFSLEFFGTGADSLTPDAQEELMTIGQDLLNNFASDS